MEYTDLRLITIDDLDEDDVLLTASLVGAPNAANQYMTPKDIAKTVEILQKNCDFHIGGIITNEQGGEATVNGWLQAAVTGLPVVDAPCNGRAHPTGVMGSMNLHKIPDYTTVQACVGGNPDTGNHIGRSHMAKEHALAVLGVADTVVHQVPVHTIRSSVSRMAAKTTLPILEAVRSIVEVAFTLVFSRFFTFGIQFDRRHFVRIDIHDVQDIGKVSRDNQLVTVQDHIARTVPLQRDTFAEAIQESQVVVQHRLIGIVQEFLQHRLMVNHADLVRSRMGDENRLVVAGNAPDTGRTAVGFIHDDGSQELLLGDFDHADSSRVHPSLLQLRCRDGLTP